MCLGKDEKDAELSILVIPVDFVPFEGVGEYERMRKAPLPSCLAFIFYRTHKICFAILFVAFKNVRIWCDYVLLLLVLVILDDAEMYLYHKMRQRDGDRENAVCVLGCCAYGFPSSSKRSIIIVII